MHRVSTRESARLRALAALALVGLAGCSDRQPSPTEPGNETPSFLLAPVSGTWATKAPMLTAQTLPAVGVINGLLYAAGGDDGSGSGVGLATVEAYDPIADTWSSAQSMSGPRAEIAGGVINGVLYTAGGWHSPTVYSTLEAFNPSTGWAPKTSMNGARKDLSVGVVNGILYAVGGSDVYGVGPLDVVEGYDPLSDTWSTVASMATTRAAPGVAVLNGILYAIGGHNFSGILGTVEAYNPTTNAWTPRKPMPTPRTFTSTVALGGLIYVIGGFGSVNNGAPAPVSIVEVYDPATDTWTTGPSMPTARYAQAADVVQGVIYVVGGNIIVGGVTSSTRTVEAFTPAYPFSGFFQPVDNPAIVNVTKAGSAVPVKFSLGSNLGLNILSSGSPSSAPYTCSSGPTDAIEQTVTATTSGLQYDAVANQYTYVWKTDKSWSGTCRKLTVNLTDGSTHVALFQFK